MKHDGKVGCNTERNTANQPNLKSKSMLMISQRLAEKLLTQLSTFKTVPNISAGQTSLLLIFDCVIRSNARAGLFSLCTAICLEIQQKLVNPEVTELREEKLFRSFACYKKFL